MKDKIVFTLEKYGLRVARFVSLSLPLSVKEKWGNLMYLPPQYQLLTVDLKPLVGFLYRFGGDRNISNNPEKDRARLNIVSDIPLKNRTPVKQVEHRALTREDGSTLNLRVYYPNQQPKHVMLWFHGGGYVLGSLDSGDEPSRLICHYTDSIVVSVDYRLAPEHCLTDALADAKQACNQVVEWMCDWRIPKKNVLVGGDSSGGNLAAMLSLSQPDVIKASFLLYPWLHLFGEYESFATYSKGLFLTKADIMLFAKQSVSKSEHPEALVKQFSPICSDDETLAKLPPVMVVTAELDILRDEGLLFSERLASLGVSTLHHRVAGQCHGFMNMGFITLSAKQQSIHCLVRFKDKFLS